MKDNIINYEDKAMAIAIRIHQGQFRKSGEPYINHPRRVAKLVNDEKGVGYRIVAWLHDVVENSSITAKDLSELFLFPDWVVMAVVAITRIKNESYLDYILRVKKNFVATRVKLADLKDNISDLKAGTKRDKYLLAQYILEKL